MRATSIGKTFTLLSLLWFCASASVASAQSSDLAVIKTGPSTAAAGANVTYSVTVINTGTDDDPSVTLSDPIPPGMTFVSVVQNSGPVFTCDTTVTCTIASLASGANANFSITFQIPGATAPGTTFTNTATVSGSNPDPNSENDSAATATTVPVPSADVYISKNGPGTVAPNTDISYTIMVGNSGPDAATSAMWSDTLPGNLTFVSLSQDTGPAFTCATPAVGAGGTISCTIGSLASATSAQFTLVAHVPAATPSGTSYTNTATISSETVDQNSEDNSATTTATVSSVDLALTKTAPATVTAGQDLAYSIILSNNGPDTAVSAQFVDNLPPGTSFVSFVQNTGPAAVCGQFSSTSAGCTIGLLASNTSATFTLTVHVASSVANGTVLSNSATASSSSFDTNPLNDSASASTTVQNSSDLSVVKTGPAGVVAGSNVSYTLTIANAGPDVAGSPSLSDTLPPGTSFVSLTQTSGPTFTCTTGATVTCTRASGLAAGASATFTLTAAVSGGLANGSTVSNTATVSSSGAPDSNPNNNTSMTSATVGASADLVVTKTASYSGTAGSNIVYTLGVTNNGPSLANAVQLSDTLPAGTHFVSLSQSSGPVFTCTNPAVGAGGTVNCSIATLAAGANAVFVLTVDTIGLSGGTLVNTATATSTTGDPNPANNTASAALAVFVPAAQAPALNWLGMLVLAAMLGAIAASQQRRNRRN